MEPTPRVTTVKKEKDPRRVEAGKRLAAISKAAKERKLRERIRAERFEGPGWETPWTLLLGVVGTAAAVGSFWYTRRSFESKTETTHTEVVIGKDKNTRSSPLLDNL